MLSTIDRVVSRSAGSEGTDSWPGPTGGDPVGLPPGDSDSAADSSACSEGAAVDGSAPVVASAPVVGPPPGGVAGGAGAAGTRAAGLGVLGSTEGAAT